MNLFLHVGTEKTGSSYLQKLCGKNRQFLRNCGFWFPDAGKYETGLQKGTISPGNADELVQYIREVDWVNVSSWLATRVLQARQMGCAGLLLSNELLFAALSSSGAVNQFQIMAAEAGIKKVSSLLMIRDPIDQALSLYKHRVKGGTASDIENWLVKGYSLPTQLSEFLVQVDQSDIQLILRKYQKQGESIEAAFFHDWLGVETPPARIENLVNPSLSLSELAVIRHIVAKRPSDQPAFYLRFLAVPQAEKALDGDIEKLAAMKAENYLVIFGDVWEMLSERLASDGGLVVPRDRGNEHESTVEYVFSEAQVRAWSEAHSETLKLRYWINARIRPRVGWLIRKVLPGFRRG